MTPYYADEWLTVYGGDCREVMRSMGPESVHCVVTSPPYWGLRDYGTEPTVTGGDPTHAHEWMDVKHYSGGGQPDEKVRWQHTGVGPSGHPKVTTGRCSCGASLGNLGLEPTPEEYVANMVNVFREVWRVLRDDGTVWLNLGDSYAAKQAVGIPWRVAFALQADGWYLRSDIIWAKPNPMPESVTDRPTKSHEYLFLLSKSPRYYYDADAVSEPITAESAERYAGGPLSIAGQFLGSPVDKRYHDTGGKKIDGADLPMRRNLRSVWTIATQPYPGAHFATFPRKLVEPCVKAGCPADGVVLDPFAGSGTTGVVAQHLGRRAVLIDLNPDYLTQAMRRNRDIPLGLVG